MVQVAIILGANQKTPLQVVEASIRLIEWNVGAVIKFSKNYKTPPWGYDSVNPYLNKVIIVETNLESSQLMKVLLRIEKSLGRKRNDVIGYADRMIDIDILYIGQEVIDTELLKLPHPRMHERNFCLIPLMDVDPKWLHPILGKNIKELLLESKDEGEVKIWED